MCHQGILFPEEREVILQTTQENDMDIESVVSYKLCSECINTFGPVIRIWRRPGKKDMAYFSKNRHDGIELAEGTIP
jgi:hypothetical protein